MVVLSVKLNIPVGFMFVESATIGFIHAVGPPPTMISYFPVRFQVNVDVPTANQSQKLDKEPLVQTRFFKLKKELNRNL